MKGMNGKLLNSSFFRYKIELNEWSVDVSYFLAKQIHARGIGLDEGVYKEDLERFLRAHRPIKRSRNLGIVSERFESKSFFLISSLCLVNGELQIKESNTLLKKSKDLLLSKAFLFIFVGKL